MPSARHRRIQTERRLRDLQRLTAAAIMRPLPNDQQMRGSRNDGRSLRDAAAEFIKPNDRLSSLERLEIYHRQYWFRLLDSLYDDYPGLRALLGERKFYKLRVAYLARYPSRSFTMRNLGDRMENFLAEHPQWTRPHQRACLDMVRFEWAQVVAFDGEQRPPLVMDDLLGRSPARLLVGLQPYLTLLDLAYPLDEFVMAVKRRDAALRSAASNAADQRTRRGAARRPPIPRPQRVFLAVHRFQNQVYFKRLDASSFRLLVALRDGATLSAACDAAFGDRPAAEAAAGAVQDWFQSWMQLGWFCRRRPS